MAGRVTHFQDWAEHKEGGWNPTVTPSAVTLNNEARTGLEKALGRSLTDDEITDIKKDIAPIRVMKTVMETGMPDFQDASFQDVKRTLGNIAKLLPSEAVRAFSRSDSTTQCLIDEAIFLSTEVADKRYPPNGDSITKAAMAALVNFTGGTSGRPSKNLPGQYRDCLASYALSLWARLDGKDCEIWSRDDEATPIVCFFSTLASIVDGVNLDRSTAVQLLKTHKTKR